MCGIVGAFAFDTFESKTDERIRRESSIFITTQLLQKTVERGKDATGVSLLWADGNYTGLKMGIPAPDFISKYGETEKNYEGILKLWREYPKVMKVFLGHCRKSSVGNSFDNKNNHPIKVDDIMVIHNGTLTNHDIIFEKLKCKRHAEVDTEAITHLLHKYTNNGTEPFTIDALRETCRRLQGPYSVLAVSGNNPFQVAQFRDTKPAEMVLVRPLKTVFVASEEKFLKSILFEYNKLGKLFTSSGLKLPYIKKEDVDFVTLPDDTAALWDLTKKIDDDTAIENLYESKKVPLIGKRIWRTTTTTYNNNNNNYSYYQGGNKNKTTEVNTSVHKKEDKDDDKDKDKDIKGDDIGLVWSKSLDKYKTQKDIEKTKNYKSVEIEIKEGEVTQLDPNEEEQVKTDEVGITKVDEGRVENLISGPAKLTEHKKDNQTTIREVDMSLDTEALKKAGDFIEDGIVKYENDDEVIDEIELSDISVLRTLPIYALANRIKKFILKQGFVAGYVCRKNEEEEDVISGVSFRPLIRKVRRATKKISTLKTVLKIASKAIDRLSNPQLQAIIDEVLSKGIKENKLDYEALSDAFSVGDLEKVILLKKIKTIIGSTNEQEKVNSTTL